MDLEIIGAEDPRCPLGGLEVPKSRAVKAYGQAHSLEKFKVWTRIFFSKVLSNYKHEFLFEAPFPAHGSKLSVYTSYPYHKELAKLKTQQ